MLFSVNKERQVLEADFQRTASSVHGIWAVQVRFVIRAVRASLGLGAQYENNTSGGTVQNASICKIGWHKNGRCGVGLAIQCQYGSVSIVIPAAVLHGLVPIHVVMNADL